MSIAKAVAEIQANRGRSELFRRTRFRATQARMDALIEEAEILVLTGAATVPDEMRHRVHTMLVAVHGRAPRWLEQVTAPVSMHDHLLVAEGRLRQRYTDVMFDVDD